MNEVIGFVEVKETYEQERLRSALEGSGELRFYEHTVNQELPALKSATIVSTFINSRLTKSELAALPNLKFIATRSTGYDHIDVSEARRRGIAVANVPAYGENTVAEHAFALIISLSRNLKRAYLRTAAENFSIEGLMGFDLKGKTLGVVGTGHIGLRVIRMAVGFGMKVLACDVKQDPFLAEVIGFQYVTFEELLVSSDIITLHVPYFPATHHLINRGTIEKLKKGALLINTARGALVDTDALMEALDQGILGGAGLDVLEGEEFIQEEKRLLMEAQTSESWEKLRTKLKNHIILGRENVIYTPHMAFYSKEAVERILDTTIENIKSFLAKKPVNLV